ncbi:MAG: sugar-binding protein [Capsulimonadales bacterium]|nr:sugar-binding protein [Capsulimonadales bacterium]
MRKLTLASVLPILLPVFLSQPAHAQTTDPSRVVAHAAWDARYLYFSFRVDDTDLKGTSTKPMSDTAKDDSIAVYLHTGKDRPEQPGENSYGMIVSAAGGFQFVRGDGKNFSPRPLFSIKYGVKLEGTINRSDDRDRGYTVTMAIPLDALGIDLKTLTPGVEFAVNTVARTEDAKITGLSGAAKTDTDVLSPKTWTRLVLAGENGDAESRKAGALVAPRVKDKPPLIDGVFRENEWPGGGDFGFLSPDIPKPIVVVKPTALPGADRDDVAPTPGLSGTVRGMERSTLARYLLAFQGDGRKAANPYRGIFGADGLFFLGEQPAIGIGPWFSVDRVSWHRSQLSELKKTGIDAALVSFAGPDSELGPLDEKSLVVLTTALREMATENVPTPFVAPCLDVRGLGLQNAPKTDLGTAEGRNTLYRAIRRWFLLIPPEFRFRVLLPTGENGRILPAYPFFLDAAEGVVNSGGPEWADEMRQRFAADFGPATGGVTLLFVGGEGFATSPALAATAPLRSGGAGDGPIKTFVVQPGVANPEVTADGKADPRFRFLPRRAGATYRESWEAATNARPTWIILDSWNDYLRGTTVDVSRQYGRLYEDATRIALIQASGLPPRALRWLSDDAPRRMRPGQLVTVNVNLMNAGAQPIRHTDDIGLVYRWRSGPNVVAEGPLRLKLSGTLLPTQSARLPIGVIAARIPPDRKPDGTPSGGVPTPLEPGEYQLEIDLSETRDGKTVLFSESAAESTSSLRLPVTVVPLGDAVEIVSATTPTMMMSGGVYGSRIRLRWLGEQPLPADSAQLVYQFLSEDGKETLFTGTAPLVRPLAPGAWETVPVLIRVGDTAAPIPGAAPEFRKAPGDPSGGYRLRWLLTRRDSPDAVPGQYVEQVSVYPVEEEVRLSFGEARPLKLNAGATVTVNVSVTNRGTMKWPRDGYRLGYHWYYPDGLEMQWRPLVTTPLPREIKPGETVTVPLTVRAPDRAGEFVLGADLLRVPDVYLSTRLVTRSGDLALLPVRTEGGRLEFVDLQRFFNVDAVAGDANPKDGDLNGEGATFPAEAFPPDAFGIAAYFDEGKNYRESAVYPSGHFSDASPSARSVAFRYGSDRDGVRNAVACDGQTVSAAGRYVGLHLALTATGGQEVPCTVTLRYKKGPAQTVELSVGDWAQPAGVADGIAERTSYRRTPQGDVAQPAILRHRTIPLDSARELDRIEFPKEKRIKIFALTLER